MALLTRYGHLQLCTQIFSFIFHTIFQEYDDKREKFEQNQQTFLMNFPDSASFYNAKVLIMQCFQVIPFYFLSFFCFLAVPFNSLFD